MLSKVVAFLKASPAVVSWVVTMAAALAARFGFHVSANTLLVVVTEVLTAMHAYVHVATRKAPKAP